MNVLDVLAKVIYCLNGRLTHESVRMMHVPKSCYLAVADLVEELFKSLCISINAVCLDKEITRLKARLEKLEPKTKAPKAEKKPAAKKKAADK